MQETAPLKSGVTLFYGVWFDAYDQRGGPRKSILMIVISGSEDDPMCRKFTADELNTMDHTAKNDVICQMQDRLDRL